VNIFIIYLSSNSASACLSERKRNLNEERERVVRCNTIASKEFEIKQGKGTGRFKGIPVWKKANRFIFSGEAVIKNSNNVASYFR